MSAAAALIFLSAVIRANGQGLTCETPKDCEVDEYNPYCSKWGYCTWTPQFGDTGPPQSKGAVEDGVRGQCRDDSDCTPWAPSCSPLGYCRGGVQDGSFGSRTNPKPGGEASDWIKANAKSGAGRNEEYYGKIEDDNRRNHVEFRKKYPSLFPKVSLDRLEEIEENVYSKCTYCKYDPNSGGGGGGGGGKKGSGGGRSKSKGKKTGGGANRSSGSSRRSGGGTKAAGGRKSNRNGNRGQSAGGGGSRGNQKNSEYQTQIKNGNIPGAAGKDYPTFSLKQLEKKGFKGIQPAPEDLVPKDYPKQGGARRTGQKAGQRSGQRPGSKSGQRSGGAGASGGNCPGSLDECMGACPSDMRVFKVCVKSCSSRCA